MGFCPECGTAYEPAVVACPRCRVALVEEWLELGVAVLPGTAFGPEYTNWVRLSLATRREDVVDAAVRLRQHYATVGTR